MSELTGPWRIFVCRECGATKGIEAQWRDGKKVQPKLAARYCGPTHEHPRRKMEEIVVVPARNYPSTVSV